MDRLVKRRGAIPSELWGAAPRRWQVAREVSAIVKDAIGWTTDNFLPHDPVDILLWGGWYDLAEVEAIWKIEERFVVAISELDIERIWKHGLTLGQLVDILLENSPCPVAWPLSGEDSLEARPCPSRAAFADLRRFIQDHCRVEASKLRPSTDLRKALPREDWRRLDGFLQARFGARGLIRRRCLGVVSPLWAWLVSSAAASLAMGNALRWQVSGSLLVSLLGLVVLGILVARLSWLTWRRGSTSAREVVQWLLEQRSHTSTNTT
jgi:hypothetical protein